MWASLSTGTSGVDARGGAARAREGAARQTPVAGPQRGHVVRAYDVDACAVATYRHNMPHTPVTTSDISSLKAKLGRAQA